MKWLVVIFALFWHWQAVSSLVGDRVHGTSPSTDQNLQTVSQRPAGQSGRSPSLRCSAGQQVEMLGGK